MFTGKSTAQWCLLRCTLQSFLFSRRFVLVFLMLLLVLYFEQDS